MAKIVIPAIAVAMLMAVLILWLAGERWRLLRRSTWEGLRAGGLRNLLNFRSLHMYVYLRWYNQYLKALIRIILPHGVAHSGRRTKKWLADQHHSKVLTPELAQAIITNHHEIPLYDLEQIIPYSMARNLVLNGPPDVAVSECPCRNSRKNPCQPTQVCMIIGQPFVNFALEHHPQSSRRLTQSEALELLRAEHERGHVHTAWFKDACLDRFYAVCNCCKCCCGGIEAMVKYGAPVIASSGYVARVDEKLCAACGKCETVCPFEAIQVDKKAVVSWEACMGCGVCVDQCLREAISLSLDEKKGVPMDVRIINSDTKNEAKERR